VERKLSGDLLDDKLEWGEVPGRHAGCILEMADHPRLDVDWSIVSCLLAGVDSVPVWDAAHQLAARPSFDRLSARLLSIGPGRFFSGMRFATPRSSEECIRRIEWK
jgi:hypothetical protein